MENTGNTQHSHAVTRFTWGGGVLLAFGIVMYHRCKS